MALDYKSSLSRYRRYLQLVQTQPLWTASLWVILSLILLITLLVLALRPTLVTIADLMGKIKSQKEVSGQLEEKIAQTQKALAQLELVREKLPFLDEALPKEARWDNLAEELQAAATESGIATESIQVNRVPFTPTESLGKQQDQTVSNIPSGVIGIKFSLITTGGEEELKKLVEVLEKKRRIIIMSAVQFEVTKEGDLRMTIQGETSYLPDKFAV